MRDETGIVGYKEIATLLEENGPEASITLDYWGNYENYNVGYQLGNVYKHNDRVYLSGLVRNGGGPISNGDVICVLPVEYRPTSRILGYAMQSGNIVRVDVQSSGLVKVIEGVNGGSDF